MALSKVNFNSMNVTPAASKAIKFNSSNNGLETGDIAGSLILLSTTTVSSSTSNVTFSSGIDSTYKEYIFRFTDVQGGNEQELVIDFSSDGGSTYDKTYTTSFFRAAHNEADSDSSVAYVTSRDLANSGARPFLSVPIGTNADESGAGFMHLFDPSNTSNVTHFLAETQIYVGDGSDAGSYSQNSFVGGFCNTTSAINAVKFEMDSGNIDSGIFKMYGVL